MAAEPGTTLAKYFEECKDKTPMERATLLEGFTEFQQQHQAFASKGQSRMPSTQSGVKHHYVAYIVNDQQQLLEVEGTRKGPHIVAEKCEDVLRGAIAEMQRRLAAGEITESLSMMTLNAKFD